MYRVVKAPVQLRGLVDAFWLYQGRGQTARVLPDGCSDLLFDLASGTASVVGAMTRAELVTVPTGKTLFGVRFRPGQAARFIDAQLSELTDGGAALDRVTRFASLSGAVAEAKSNAERCALVTRALLEPRARVRAPDARVETAIATLLGRYGQTSIAELASAVGLGERQMERCFLERVGLGPKRFARVMRFCHALELACARPGTHAALAAHAGYSDEPHLQREFRALSGLPAQALLRERDVGFVQGVARVSA